ncbi:hypothetical protein, partial [Aeromonas caviae]|uniref:hypothetical protein n=1 Tax=Aeromonas caviae TaxID=648 RepID=UPI001CC7BEA3
LRAHEDRFHKSVFERLPPPTRERLDALLRPEKTDSEASRRSRVGGGKRSKTLLWKRSSWARNALRASRSIRS